MAHCVTLCSQSAGSYICDALLPLRCSRLFSVSRAVGLGAFGASQIVTAKGVALPFAPCPLCDARLRCFPLRCTLLCELHRKAWRRSGVEFCIPPTKRVRRDLLFCWTGLQKSIELLTELRNNKTNSVIRLTESFCFIFYLTKD